MISKVKVEHQLIKVYDSNDQILSSLDSKNKKVVAVSNDFFVVYHNLLIEVYDSDSSLISSMPKDIKIVKGTIGNTFTVYNDVFIETYNINCERLFINNIPSAVKKLKERELHMTKSMLLVEQARLEELIAIFVTLQRYEDALILKPLKSKLDEAIIFLENLI